MSNITTFPRQKLSADSAEVALRAIVFNISDYIFGLPVGAVQKIIICPPITNPIQEGIAIVNLGSQTATVLDLRYKFAENITEETTTAIQRRFLILIATKQDHPCGIIVDRAPVIQDIPASSIEPIPPSYREVKQFNFASHLATLPSLETGNKADPVNIFLLGMEDIYAKTTVRLS